jgi:hypothetical protein
LKEKKCVTDGASSPGIDTGFVRVIVENTQNYWCSGLCPSSGIKKIEHDFTETGPISVLRRREEDPYSVGPFRKR